MTKKLLNGVELDYVSGSYYGYLRIGNANKDLEKENIDDVNKLLKFTQNKLQGYFTFSTLFNAYQEEKGGKILSENNALGHEKVYSDSGGLQVLTTGKIIDDEIREKVYAIQAKYSDFAMTFDEMPLKVVESEAAESFTGDFGQIFIDELIPITAKNSAMHIQKQINKFEELHAKTKILPIIHGYDPISFLKYVENIFENLEHIGEHIQGISIASLRGHADNKVGIMKLFDFVPKILNNDTIDSKYKEHVHFLGVARPQRIMPLIMMIKKGLLPIKKMSFDSTAITKSYTFGRVYQTVEEWKNPENYNSNLTLNDYKDKSYKNIDQFYRNVHKEFKDYDDYMFSSWEDLANHSQNNGVKLTPSKQFKKYGIEYERKYLQQIRITNMYHTFTYLSMIEAYITDELTVNDIFKQNESICHIFETFESKNTLKEFEEVCDYFYTTATKGRTNLRVLSCKTIDEFEQKYNTKQLCMHEVLGIDKDVAVINDTLKKPWIKSSMRRAKKNNWQEDKHPGNSLF